MLLYKNYLLQKINSNQGIFFKEAVYNYVSELGYKPQDDYDAITILKNIKDENYYGENYNEKGKYYLFDRQGNLFWFAHMKDMIMYAGGDAEWNTYNFYKFRRHWYNDFMYLAPEDIFELDEIINTKLGVYCETKDLGFSDVDEAARWLANGGYASSAENAKKQLVKHLEGKTALCYKMKFIKY